MGRRGPKPKSAELESLQGFPGRRRRATEAKIEGVDRAHSTIVEPQDSRSVPCDLPAVVASKPPPILKTKREREIWAELILDPVRGGWFRYPDLAFIARHVSKLARLEAMMSRRIRATYETRTGSGERLIRANPEYSAMMALDREVRAEEQLLAGNPLARLTLETKTGEPRAPKNPTPGATTPQPSAADARPPSTGSPLGILKPGRKPETH